MKTKYIAALLLLLGVLGNVKAQQKRGVDLGFHGGAGAVFFYEPRFTDVTLPMSGGMAGVSMQYNFTRIVALRAEVDYERKGALSNINFDATNPQRGYSADIVYDRIHYITVPVTCKLSFGRRVQFFTNLGLYAGFNVRAVETTSSTFIGVGDGGYSTARNADNITRQVAKADGGLVTGLGLTTHMGKRSSFMVEVRNNMGFADIHAKNSVAVLYQKNNATWLLMGFAFNVSKVGGK